MCTVVDRFGHILGEIVQGVHGRAVSFPVHRWCYRHVRWLRESCTLYIISSLNIHFYYIISYLLSPLPCSLLAWQISILTHVILTVLRQHDRSQTLDKASLGQNIEKAAAWVAWKGRQKIWRPCTYADRHLLPLLCFMAPAYQLKPTWSLSILV